MARLQKLYRRVRSLKWLSPGSYLLCALVFLGVYWAADLLGWRQTTMIFCGTLAEGESARIIQSWQAVMYTVLYMAAVVISPILLIAACVFHMLAKAAADLRLENQHQAS